VLVEQAQPEGLLITNGEFVGRWSSEDSVCVEIGPKAQGKVSLTNCSFWGPIDRVVWMRSPTGQFTANACHFVNWNNHGNGAPAIQVDAGRAIIQGCTFEQDDLDVLVGSKVFSAILVANQAPAGFRVENRAGSHTQLAANQPDPVPWSAKAREGYRLDIGAPGDARYLDDWLGPERVGAPGGPRAMRWSTENAQITLPVNPGEAYEFRMDLDMPHYALAEDAGLYLGSRRIARLHAGPGAVTAALPPSTTGQIKITLRCKGWVPKELIAGSQDTRKLGASVYSVTMKTAKAGPKLFNANVGGWK